ncbi:unnamed protein product [Adineta steineri]|uniref:Uncharacterized protein n=1 Tax=Adineta steineri TaxID=433720 RepID=A0A813N9A2_9BILA|nr:unnamed protein product [Adineta steineri]CAF1180628.1 unnamed protein product [Adineta steineri]CAF1423132.1 unnamed protein product [Adineta steineri]CAF3832800.1 unnamed protein product [Adineta steineri]CAF3945515.1 unnamed protein product [Adineta steineri]
MSSLLMNLRLFSRLPTSVHVSRMNATTSTSSKINLPQDVAKPNHRYFRIAAAVIRITGLLALFRMSRREEQLIVHAADEKPHPNSQLHVKKDLQKFIPPIITSFGYLQSFQSEFFWLGTRDYSSYLTISDAIDFRQTIANETEIFSYNHQLTIQVDNLFAQMWNCSTLIFDEKYLSTMNNIELPLAIDTLDKINNLYQNLINKYNIFLPMFQFDKKFYCRISAQIYMELNDYEKVGYIVLNAISNSKFLPFVKHVKDNFHFV